MSELKSVCFLEGNDIVGYAIAGTDWRVKEGTITKTTLPYPYSHVVPLERLTVDNGVVRERTDAEIAFEIRVEEGEVIRDNCIDTPIVVHEKTWLMKPDDRANIQDAIDEAALFNLPDDTVQDWIMADGSIFKATPLKLKQVLSAYRKRKKDIFNEYILWLQGGAVTDYVCSCGGNHD